MRDDGGSDLASTGGAWTARGGRWVVGQITLLLAAAATAPAWGGQWHNPAARATGLALLGLGAVSGLAGMINLGRSLTPFPRPREASNLVRHGIYRWVRHPLYGSLIATSAGWALVWSSLPGLLVAAVLAVFLNAKADHEENWLRRRYPEYAAYAARVKKLVPFIY